MNKFIIMSIAVWVSLRPNKPKIMFIIHHFQSKTTVHTQSALNSDRASSTLAANPSNYRSGTQPVRSVSVPSPDPTIEEQLVLCSSTIQRHATRTMRWSIGWTMPERWLVRASSSCWWATKKISRRLVRSRSWRRVTLHRNMVCVIF